MMRTLRRLAAAGQVWLATALMLFANVPHFVCQCPDGHVKPLCLGTAANDSGCCCGDGHCCAVASAKSCCRPHAPAESQGRDSAPCCATTPGPQHPESP